MTNEERDIITRFIQRVGGAPQAAGATGSVPATAPQLPPVDPDADRLLADLFTRYPEARYRITQMAFVQEAALAEAHNRIQHLQWEAQQAQQQAQAQPQQGASPWGQQAQPQQQSRGFFGGLFGGGQPQAVPPPQYAPPPGGQYGAPPPPQYPPGYQPGMFRSGGSGFLGSALSTAAGVAGGVVVGNALMDLFSGNRGGLGGGFGGPGFAGTPSETVVNNYYGDAGQGASPQDNPWSGAGQDAGGADFANAPDAGSGDPFGGGGADPGQWDQTTDPDPDPGTDQGWDDSGSSSDDDLV